MKPLVPPESPFYPMAEELCREWSRKHETFRRRVDAITPLLDRGADDIELRLARHAAARAHGRLEGLELALRILRRHARKAS